MRIGVAAERLTRSTPGLENCNIIRDLFQLGRVDESVDLGEILIMKRGQDGVGDLEPRLARWQRTMGRKVVEGKGDLLRGGVDSAEERQDQVAEKEFHPLFPYCIV